MMPALGVMLGSFFVPKLLTVFPGRLLLLSAVAVEIFLIFLLLVSTNLAFWFVIRLLMGLTGSVLFTVSDSWICEIVPDRKRGRVMGMYGTALYLSFAAGPLILTITGVNSLVPFLFGMILMCLSVFPLMFVGQYLPSTSGPSSFSLMRLTRVAPLLVFGVIVVAFKETSIGSLLPVYAVRNGLTESFSTFALFIAALGGALLQIPIGWLADYCNRLWVLSGCSLIVVFGAAALPFVVSQPELLCAVVFIWMGCLAGIATIVLTLAGQWFKGMELATAMAAFGVFWGLGGLVGPLISGAAMDVWDPHGLSIIFIVIAILFLIASMQPRWRHLTHRL